MIAALAAAVISTATFAPQPDTVIVVRPGTALEVENFGGEIAVKTWDRNAVKVVVHHSPRDRVTIEHTRSALTLKSEAKRWVPGSVTYLLTVPVWMGLDLSGINTDISVENSRGDVHAETVQGEVTVEGADGYLSLSSIMGDVLVKSSKGRVEASSVNSGVRVERTTGPVTAESVNGPVVLTQVDADSVDASSVNGCIAYDGTFSDEGYYHFSSHNGLIDVAVPERAGATITVATWSGGFDSDFPVTIQRTRRGKHFSFTVGSGRSRIELESFQGSIHLRRPGGEKASCSEDSNDEREDKQTDQDEEEGGE